MIKAQPLPDSLSGRSFTLGESDDYGISRRRTAGRDLYTPGRCIRVPWGVQEPLADRVRPLLELTPGGMASHSTAALLWGVPLPPWLAGSFEIHISKVASSAPPWRAGVVGHHTRFKPGEVDLLGGMPVTSPLRTWLDLAAMLELDDLVAAGDFLVCEHDRIFGPKRVALVNLFEVRESVRHEFHRRGIVKAREAADLLRVGANSPPEKRIRLALERAGVPGLTLNHVVVDADGSDASWPDLALPEWKIALEYDGAHHLTARQKAIDEARNRLMERLGWQQLRITKAMLDNDGDKAVVALVRNALRVQGWTGPFFERAFPPTSTVGADGVKRRRRPPRSFGRRIRRRWSPRAGRPWRGPR
ncbi:endonuclease domain-containing protein [Arthrobacter livingstonensis]|uniref:endonuclease domain-containing protein n=1 Tax=Arthrobacter livingstonensis TaxID=670078 RepID=UPI0011B574EC|nr:hypothetical protein [Arthrobacter livingstonensis]